ncbi:MAG TPA: metal-dependent hydrolase [Candidatus Atopostipes pullistercoris]|uniref:UPF0173 metal-dependent hydrolase H9808_00810 n=1 Tax=Candidatus Atopostipes pullistercoris TaxID=2838467 RepID=A0A9D2JWK9_9LACT|nr:metal-dependent hydrolase [Candidatus Atopostipes pullistercoris]
MKATFHGHAVVSLETEDGTKLLFDPFINGNEACNLNVDTVEADYIFVTHAHSDHLGDTVEIAKRTKAKVITTVEIASYLSSFDLETHGMQPGGSHTFDFGEVKLTPAIHGSSIEIDGKPHTLGVASGILVTADAKTVYHVGDTALYSDMKLIGDLVDIDLAFIPIGDNYTMGPEDASLAAKWLQAKRVVPIHYNVLPLTEQDPENYIKMLDKDVGFVPEIGESFAV